MAKLYHEMEACTENTVLSQSYFLVFVLQVLVGLS